MLTGVYVGAPNPNPDEVSAWRWEEVERIASDLADQPDKYTPWLLPALEVLSTPPNSRLV